MKLWRLDSVCLVEKLKLREPPSALRPTEPARASSKVDLPLPFSPTKNVTGYLKSNRLLFSDLITGIFFIYEVSLSGMVKEKLFKNIIFTNYQ